MRASGWMATVAAAALLAGGQGASAAGAGLAVTIYNNDLALVQDARTLDLTGGRQTVEFKNVSAQIRPETVSLAAPGVSVVEQNFDYDLLTPAALMQKAVGQTVTIVRMNPKTGVETREQALVLADNDGVVLKIGDHIEVLRDDGLPARVIFDKLPDNLRASPTLSIMVDAKSGGAHAAKLSYLTPGLGWRADYVALYDEAAGAIDVQGWITLTNTSGTTYDNADTLLVAGSPNASGGAQSPQPYDQQRASMEQAGQESGARARLGDYYLYPLAERTTIANNQTKQVSFLDVRGAPASHGYEFRLSWLQTIDEPQSAASVYRFSTSAAGGLGDQLPAGTVRFYIRDKTGAPQFIGEDAIDHTPMGSHLSLSTGDAFDVKIKTAVMQRDREDLLRWKTSMRYTLTNALPKPVTVNLIQEGLWGDTRIVAESQPSTRDNADQAEWRSEERRVGKECQ